MDSVEYVEYCRRCGQFGFFTAEDSFLCPECHASATGVAIATPFDDEEGDEAYFGKEVDDMFIDGFWENFDAQFDEGEE